MRKAFKSIVFIFLVASMKGICQSDSTLRALGEPKALPEVCKVLNGDTIQFFYNNRYQLVFPVCADIFRVSKIDITTGNFDGDFTDYSIDSTVILTGTHKSGKRSGEFRFYYPNGQLQASGDYLEGNKTGTWNYWYSNGQNQQKIEFTGSDTLIIDFWDDQNNQLVINGNGRYYTFDSPSEATRIEGTVNNKRKEGTWKKIDLYFHLTTNIEKYKNGLLISGKFQSLNSSTERYSKMVYCKIEQTLPFTNAELFQMNYCFPKSKSNKVDMEFPGGIAAFYKKIDMEFVIPEIALLSSVGGTIAISTIINQNGEMTDFKELSHLGFGLEEELIRVLGTVGKWIPAKEDGKPISKRKTIKYTIRYRP